MTIQRIQAQITDVADISPTAREVTITLPTPLPFIAGAFVNLFLEHDGVKERRAYSISSSDTQPHHITLSIRKGTPGGVSERFWRPDITHTPVQIMGPLGLNTADVIEHPRVFLCGFGIGVSVIKSIADHLIHKSDITELWIITGSRTESEVLYKEYFESLLDSRVHVRFVISKPEDTSYPYTGHIPDHIHDLDFSNATVYVCGQGEACLKLKEDIEQVSTNTQFLIESFD